MDGAMFTRAVEALINAMQHTRRAPRSPQSRSAQPSSPQSPSEESRKQFRDALKNIADLIRASGGNPDQKSLDEVGDAFDGGDLDSLGKRLHDVVAREAAQMAMHVRLTMQPAVLRLKRYIEGLSSDASSHIP